ncbi:hypothetical protein M5K25_006828 [Dendrobium thyrsiflorum]|uniref:Uncharacterized protein n=1 Tax=Dendrobium thyrsiflorum TaxID=117978 RepID=A0ABD0VJT4_DENTH
MGELTHLQATNLPSKPFTQSIPETKLHSNTGRSFTASTHGKFGSERQTCSCGPEKTPLEIHEAGQGKPKSAASCKPTYSHERRWQRLESTGTKWMVGEWMMDPIKIPWFCHPESSWSLVYLVIGGSRPNLTERTLSVAMGCFIQGYLVDRGFDTIEEHMGAGHNHNIVMPFGGKSPGSKGPRVITVYLAVPFGGKIVG